MKLRLVIVLLALQGTLHAQDSITELNLVQFLQQIKENHPVALISANNIMMANQVITLSKGAFDPTIIGGINQKYFDGKTYYSTISSGIKIPTRIGVDLKVMADWNRGAYLNNENVVPSQGITAVGFELPLGRGMFTDERRTQLKRAAVAFQQSSFEQQLALNELLYSAGQTFINWQEQYAQLTIALEACRLADIRYQQLVTQIALGERAEVDTIEASAQLFLRELEVQQRQLNLQNAQLAVENYLWDKGVLPLLLDSTVHPSPLLIISPTKSLLDTIDQHPILSWYDLKRNDLFLERKLKVEQLKPQLSINYNILQTPQNAAAFNYSFSNYKWGAQFYMPILLRKERASIQITNIKLNNVTFEKDMKLRELETKQLQIRNEWYSLYHQAQLTQTIALRYEQLAQAERLLFDGGESSLFIINAREISYLSAQSKYIETLSKLQKISLSDQYVKGELGR